MKVDVSILKQISAAEQLAHINVPKMDIVKTEPEEKKRGRKKKEVEAIFD